MIFILCPHSFKFDGVTFCVVCHIIFEIWPTLKLKKFSCIFFRANGCRIWTQRIFLLIDSFIFLWILQFSGFELLHSFAILQGVQRYRLDQSSFFPCFDLAAIFSGMNKANNFLSFDLRSCSAFCYFFRVFLLRSVITFFSFHGFSSSSPVVSLFSASRVSFNFFS